MCAVPHHSAFWAATCMPAEIHLDTATVRNSHAGNQQLGQDGRTGGASVIHGLELFVRHVFVFLNVFTYC